MLIYPAIDLMNQKCVRLTKGISTAKSIYHEDPVAMARQLVAEGARQLHLIDLDAAIKGSPENYPIIQAICQAVDVPLQVGGGIRDIHRAEELIAMGVDRLIVSTAPITKPDFFSRLMDRFPDHIAVSIDAREETVLIKGWVQETDLNLYDFATDLCAKGVKTFIYTDTNRDGMLKGPNFEVLNKLNNITEMNLIAAGGVSTMEDLKKLKSMNLYGAIIGKALYENKMTMKAINDFQEKG